MSEKYPPPKCFLFSIEYPHLVERVSEAEVGDGLGVLEGGVGPVHPHVPPDQLLLLLAAPEGDPGLPRQLLPHVNGAPEIVLPEATFKCVTLSRIGLVFSMIYHCC